MTQHVFRVTALSTTSNNIISTVVSQRKSARYIFRMVEPSQEEVADIAIFDGNDSLMPDKLAAALARNPKLKVVHLVRDGAPAQTSQQYDFDLPYGQIVTHLIPLLYQIAAQVQMASGQEGDVAPTGGKVARLASGAEQPRLRALVIDDSPTVRMQLAQTVERIGIKCDTADGAQEALAHLADNGYDVIYVDVVMPGMDGYKLTREIKRTPEHKNTPVIILTSQSSPFDRARGALAGCDTYLTKPVDLKRFFEATTKVLRKNFAEAELAQRLQDPTQSSTAAPNSRASVYPTIQAKRLPS